MAIKVLIADDHGVVRRGLRLLLEQYPELLVIGEAANGRDAVIMAAKLSPQIVIMDVGMPLLNGIEAAGQILAASSHPGIILATAVALEESPKASIERPSRNFCTSAQLVRIHRLLPRSTSRSE